MEMEGEGRMHKGGSRQGAVQSLIIHPQMPLLCNQVILPFPLYYFFLMGRFSFCDYFDQSSPFLRGQKERENGINNF